MSNFKNPEFKAINFGDPDWKDEPIEITQCHSCVNMTQGYSCRALSGYHGSGKNRVHLLAAAESDGNCKYFKVK